MAEYADEAEYAAEPVSDGEKVAIATHMLMSSPPGQFWEVLTGRLLRINASNECRWVGGLRGFYLAHLL